MKNNFFLRVVALIVFAVNSVNAQELIQGGAFSSTDISSWTIGIGTDNIGGGVTFGATTNLPNGSINTTCLQFKLFPGVPERQVYQRIRLEAGKVYKVSAKMYFSGRTVNRNAQIYIMKDASTDNGSKFSEAIVNQGERSKDKALFLEGWPYVDDFTPNNTDPTPLFNLSGICPLSTVGTGSDLIAPLVTEDYIVLIKVGQWAPSGLINVNNTLTISDLSVSVTNSTSIPVTSVSLPATVNLSTIGQKSTLTAKIVPSNATNQDVTWSSSDTGVATVSPTGEVTAVSNGNAVITVTTTDGQKTASTAVSVQTYKFNLVWQDEFTGTGKPDPTKWGYELGHIRGTKELQYYTDRVENVRQFNDNLEITLREEAMGGDNYTSGSVITKGKAEFAYGKIEGKFKMPVGAGLWSCFWTLGANYYEVGWPKCGEIDIFEHINEEAFIHSTAHWTPEDSTTKISKGGVSDTVDVTQWHVYSIEWTPSKIAYLVDGKIHRELNITNNVDGTMPFHKPHYILINQVMGSATSWPGGPNAATQLPATLYCDYIKVYEYAPDVPAEVSAITFSPSKINLPITSTLKLSVNYIPYNVANKSITWQSSNPLIASVDPVSGLITGVAIGTATVTGTSVSGGKTSTCEVTVTSLNNNFVLNPSFELDNAEVQLPQKWGEWSPNNDTTLGKVVTGTAHSGNYYGEIRGLANTMFLQPITGLPSGNYTLKAWVRSSGGQNYSVLSIKNYKTGAPELTKNLNTAMSVWTEVTIPNINITSGVCEINIYSSSAAGQWIEFDDVELSLAPVVPVSLVLNPSFELDNAEVQVPQKWSEWSPNSTTAMGKVVAGNSHSGTYHAEIKGPANTMIFQTLSAVPAGNYSLKAWVRSSGGQGYSILKIKNYKTGAPDLITNLNTAMGVWTEITIPNIDVTLATPQIEFYSNNTATQWIEFDDVSLTLAPVVPITLVQNPSFELDNAEVQVPQKWSEWSPNSTTAIGKVVAGNSHSGTYHAEIKGPADTMMFQTLSAVPAGNYTLKAWVRSSGGQGYSILKIKNYKTGAPDLIANLNTAMGVWTEITIPNIDVTLATPQIEFYSINTATQWIEFDDVSLTLSSTLSNDSFTKDTFSIFPNPVSDGILNVFYPGSEIYDVSICNLLGETLLVEKGITGNRSIITSSLSSGLYLLKLSKGNEILIKKIIIP